MLRRSRMAAGLMLLGVLGIVGCETGSPTSEAPPSQAIVHGLHTELSVAPGEVAPGEVFTAEYTITNRHSEPMRLESSCVAIARSVVYRAGQEAGLVGSGSGCFTAIGHHEIAAGQTLRQTWDVEAAVLLRSHADGTRDIRGAEAGTYVVRILPDVFRVNGSEAQLPILEAVVRIR